MEDVSVWTLSRTTFKVLVGERVVPVHTLNFYAREVECDPDSWEGRDKARAKRKVAYLRDRYLNFGPGQEVYFVKGRPEAGDHVFFGQAQDLAVWHDDEPFPAREVLRLEEYKSHKRRNVWTTVEVGQ